MASTNGLPSDSGITRELIEGIASSELGAKLRSQVAAAHPGAGRDELEEAFQQACLLALRKCRGRSEGEVFTWLRTTTRRELGHMRRRERNRYRRELLAVVTAPELQFADSTDTAADELLVEREDQAEVERVARAVLWRLSQRQRQIVVLHSRGYRRSEIAERLGITPRTVKRALERILAAGRDELVRLAGRGCGSGDVVVARLAFGLASPREARQAQLHLATCSRCRVVYERLDLWREKVATLLPVPAAAQADPGIVERALHGAADAVANLKQRALDGTTAGRDHLADASGQVKQHATASYYRVVDPTPLAGARPGAVAAALAGCLVIGGGASYCVERGVSPIGGIAQLASRAAEKRPPVTTKKRPVRERIAVTPVSTPAPKPSPIPVATATAAPPESSPQPAAQAPAQPTPEPTPPPTPEEEYEPVAPAAEASAGSAPAPAPVRTPAPAPGGGPGEFDGP